MTVIPGVPRTAVPHEYAKTPVTIEPPTTYPPSNNIILVLVVTVLCGLINPCALLALKHSFDSAKAIQAYNYVKARREGIAAKHFAIGGIILGALVLSIIYYRGIINALNQNHNPKFKESQPKTEN